MSRQVLVGVIGAIVAVNLAIAVVDWVLPSPSGRRSSSLATAPAGFAAWAELARRDGAEVVALRDDLARARLPPGATVIALDVPALSRADARVLRAHARDGGRVVAGGLRPGGWLEVLGPGLRWQPSGPRAARVDGFDLRLEGSGSWTGGRLLVERGGVRLLADASPLHNARLAEAGNAAFALELAGDGPLVFAEAPHGYRDSSGLAALPVSAKWALGTLLAAALLWMLAHGRRLGPPEAPHRVLEPPRAAYVDAVGAALARTRDPAGAMEPVRAALDAEPPADDAQALALARRYAEEAGAR